jgi:hypothetical protein
MKSYTTCFLGGVLLWPNVTRRRQCLPPIPIPIPHISHAKDVIAASRLDLEPAQTRSIENKKHAPEHKSRIDLSLSLLTTVQSSDSSMDDDGSIAFFFLRIRRIDSWTRVGRGGFVGAARGPQAPKHCIGPFPSRPATTRGSRLFSVQCSHLRAEIDPAARTRPCAARRLGGHAGACLSARPAGGRRFPAGLTSFGGNVAATQRKWLRPATAVLRGICSYDYWPI